MTERAAGLRGLGGRGTFIAAILLTALALVAFGSLVSAQTITVTNVDGDWENTTVEGGGSASGEGSSYIYWGTGDDGPSGYRFTAVASSITVPQETPVKVGTFSHENWPVTGNTLLSADLEVTLELDGLPDMVFTIPFGHDETDNRPDTYSCYNCLPESSRCVDISKCEYTTSANDICDGCADRVQITSSSVSTTVDGISCTVTATFESTPTFYTAEKANNTIDLKIELKCDDAAKITVQKQTDPGGDSTSFSFSGDLGSFTLNGDGDSESAVVSPGTYTITENSQSGWTLTSITGDDDGTPDNGVTLTVADEDDVTVIFNNRKDATIVVEKETTPGGDTTDFDFSGDLGSFTLDGDGDSESFGVAPGTYTVTEDAITGWVLTSITGDNNGDPTDGATVTVSAGQTKTLAFNNKKAAAYVTITPGAATNEVGDAHTFVITAVSTGAVPDSWSLDSYSVTPAPDSVSVTGPSVAGDGMSATWNLTINDASAGSFEASATVDVDFGVTTVTVTTDGTGSNSSPADKTYVDAQIDIGPASATNQVDDPHTVTATVQVNDGTGWSTAGSGVTVNFSLVNNTAGASFVGSSSATTNASGQASVDINSSSPGSVDIHASTTVTVGGLPLTRQTDGTGENSDDAGKDYIDVKLTLTPSTDTNQVGDPHVFTATLEYTTNGTSWSPLAGETIDFVKTSGPGTLSASSATTDGSGEATVTLTSSVVGSTVVEASFDGTVVGASAEADDTADKDWIDVKLTLTPSTDTNQVGDQIGRASCRERV